uniref:Uncharacterized protein n=1 Tax=Hucho hucho TaxID=62062 RepID=A0A4W5RW72_9TELE
MFLLDDMGLQCFSKIVNSLDFKNTWIQGEWSENYDDAYVKRKWIAAPLLRWSPEIEILMAQLATRISRGSQLKKVTKKNTEPQEFSLTKLKAHPLPALEPTPLQEKQQPSVISQIV